MTQVSASDRPRPVLLCILDGWGWRESGENNAIALAATPTYDRLVEDCPTGRINASEGFVGLPQGQMGNSEVGHMNLGAGRIVMQDLPRIDAAVADGSLAGDPTLKAFADRLTESGGTAHIMGLLSPGGVHSHQDHMAALTKALSAAGVNVKIHAFLDGRDTPPKSADGFVRTFEEDIAGHGTLATVTGRFFAMDRDNRWNRVEKAYNLMLSGSGLTADSADQAIAEAYGRDESDEFVQPTAVGGYAGMEDGDGLIMANFRADRAREILSALVDPAFDGFEREKTVSFAARVGMSEYSKALSTHLEILFPPVDLAETLGEVVAEAGRTQLRIAETEKYPHVTFFLNGGREEEFTGETRILIPSPKVATYDLQPEMSAVEVTDNLVDAIEGGKYDLIVANYANPDMVGHTGNLDAAITAVQTIDACLARIETALKNAGGTMLLTADHGNVEQMRDPASNAPHTAHTTNLVPTVLVNGDTSVSALKEGKLADVAPTLLELMGLPQPGAMTGSSILERTAAQERKSA